MPENKRLVPVVVKEGKPPIWIEMSNEAPVAETGGNWVMVSKEAAEKEIPDTMDQALDRLRPLVEVLFERISSVSKAPKEVELNLGLKLSGKVGIFVAESSGEATIAVKLKWTS
jgi:hypothetical protein